MITLDEAIAHAREVASEQRRRNGTCTTNDNECDKFSNCMKCAEEHEQLAEWLEELKAYKEKPEGWMWDEAEQKGYNKAIDDAKNVILQTLDNEILVDTLHLRLEQLKAGD